MTATATRVRGAYQGGNILFSESVIESTARIAAYGGDIKAIVNPIPVHIPSLTFTGNVTSFVATRRADGAGGNVVSVADDGHGGTVPVACDNKVDIAFEKGLVRWLRADHLKLDVQVEKLAWAILYRDQVSQTWSPNAHGVLDVTKLSGYVRGKNTIIRTPGMIYTRPA